MQQFYLVGFWREFHFNKNEYPSIFEDIKKISSLPEKDKILSYLRNGVSIIGTRSALYCPICKNSLSQEVLTDGTWFWTTEMVHYFEEHNIVMPSSFIKHIEHKKFIFPQINTDDDGLMDQIIERYFQIEKIEENYRFAAHQKQNSFFGLLMQKAKNLFN